MTRVRWAALCAWALVVAWAAGCARREDEDAEVTAVVPVRTAAVEEHEFADQLEAPGQWKSSGDVSLPAPFAAVVESLGPRPGDHVAAGDTLEIGRAHV